jgi:hypothetical protein
MPETEILESTCAEMSSSMILKAARVRRPSPCFNKPRIAFWTSQNRIRARPTDTITS